MINNRSVKRAFTIASILLMTVAPTACAQRRSYDMVSCWTMKRNLEVDNELEATFSEFSDQIGAKTFGEGVQVEVRSPDRRYQVVYARYIPAYGRMAMTFWDPAEADFQRNDQLLFELLAVYGELKACPEGYKATTSG